MKKLFFLVLLFFIAQIGALQAEQPIPSRHARIYHMGNFREHHYGNEHRPNQLKSNREKRDMQIQVSSSGGTPRSSAIIYVYSADYQDVLGPFIVNSGESITIPVDDREWGAFIMSDDHVYVDVWSSNSAT